jgi:hypothetical protein
MCDRSGRVQSFGTFGPVSPGARDWYVAVNSKYFTNKVCSILFLHV